METAAALLADVGNPPLAPHLAANIRAAVGSFRPACVLDQLKARRRKPQLSMRLMCETRVQASALIS